MKYAMLVSAILLRSFVVIAQENKTADDSAYHYRSILKDDCPKEFLIHINNDSLTSKAVLFVLNEALHPLGRNEFFDEGAKVKTLQFPMRMNRCSMLYADSGLHRYHTIYQRLKDPVTFEAGKIYIARLFSRKVWPLGGLSIIKKNEKGEPVEYAAVLFEYINAAHAAKLFGRMKNKEILENE